MSASDLYTTPNEESVKSSLLNAINKVATAPENLVVFMHPSNLTANEFIYSGEHSSSFNTSQYAKRQGVIRVPANGKSLNSTSVFSVQNQNIHTGHYLSGTYTFVQYSQAEALWIYDMIRKFSTSFFGTQSQNFNGISMRDMLMKVLPAEKRNILVSKLNPYVNAYTGAVSIDFVVPLWLPFSNGPLNEGAYYLDAESLAGNYTISIDWKSAAEVLYGATGHGNLSLNGQFDRLELTLTNELLHLNSEMNPNHKGHMMRVPGFQLNSISQYGVANIESGSLSPQQITLTGIPSGQLVSIYVSCRGSNSRGANNNLTRVSSAPLNFKQLKLTYQGTDIIDLRNDKEIALQFLYNDGQSDGNKYNLYSTPINGTGAVESIGCQLTCLDFLPNPWYAFNQNNYCIAKNYSGQTLNLTFVISETASSIPYLDFDISYVMNEVLVISPQGSVSYVI